jgi:hypothetical protein
MTEYQAKSTHSLLFELTQGDELIGKLSYQSWFKFDALLQMANNLTYPIKPKGFWGTTIELKDHENVLLKFTMNWQGDIVLQTYFNNQEEGYLFKHRGIFKESFILLDQEGIVLLEMKPHLKWSKMNYEYQLITSDYFDSFSHKELLILTSLHCANYYMSMIAMS